MPTRVCSRRFVGREPQLAERRRALDEATAGRAAIALVGGESGVGKTRLVDELVTHARASGARALIGDCLELAEGELPYAPLIGALRPLMRAGDPALAEVRAELDLPSADGAAQGRFFELLLTALDRLSAEQPLLLVLEDLHWADRSTRDFLVFVARNLCRERVLVVATYRTDELVRRHPLRALLPELERLDGTLHLQLARLTREQLADQLADILGAPPSRELLDRLFARCEGNPLFAEELVAAGSDGRGELPPTLRDALTVRVESLSEPTQDVLRVVAAAARADEALLSEVSGMDRAALRPALREALAHQVLVHADDGRYAFRHALLREAMHDELLPGEHVELHEALARALAARVKKASEGDLDTITAIAHHFASAGAQPEALAWSVAAASAAERVHAPAEEAAQLERALTLWRRVPDAQERVGHDHARLLERLAAACDRLGNDERAVHVLEKALAELG
ncbi:MAG TPA: AAA family ATPase, partial [Capillimicrobium sp.]